MHWPTTSKTSQTISRLLTQLELGEIPSFGNARESRRLGPIVERIAELIARASDSGDTETAEALAQLQQRFDLICDVTSDGLWDMTVRNGNAADPSNPFQWSQQFRRLLGFRDTQDFPNVLGSWSDRLHPEDKARTLAAFKAHLADSSGRTPFDVKYRLATRSGDYRWFRAQGDTARCPRRAADRCRFTA
ncbi:PAS domain-containing protein [Salinicola tamaricis]|uniref:PAS domain-containing protein n=1 Tax=Salinicola tamaricis TaxID=1771309 RepID=UPI00101AE61F|nr:PAS domain-containing protein [Salinicola tamaricis]